ncbi:hypothetical protein LCGC14_0604180 [marine sediment metagenome]|uniref:Uncharacterized protein n=1 Tax=marine sediment metagenome TaxID=412755 RepID=A0A0F9TVQ1_9ZZZZ
MLDLASRIRLGPWRDLNFVWPVYRDGQLTSAGDIKFDAELRAANPDLGYKDTADVARWLSDAMLSPIDLIPMPANNLAFISRKP